NGTGMAGVAGNAQVMPLKVLDNTGSGLDSWIIPAYMYAADHGAKVLSCSFGGTGSSQAEQDSITYAYNHGCLVVAAMGNDGNNVPNFPSAYTHVMGIGATDGCDFKTFYSNTGSDISVVAPGGAADGVCTDDIMSASLAGSANCLGSQPTDGSTLASDYSPLAGTSFSTPETAGLAAVLFSLNPSASPDSIRSLIEQTADAV